VSANHDEPDWQFLADGAVNLFWRKEIFNEAKDALRRIGYLLIEIEYRTLEEFCNELGAALKWREQFGYEPWTGNLDALNDGLRTPPFPLSRQMAICIERFHRFVDQQAPMAHGLLDVIEYQARNQLLVGNKLLALVQMDNSAFESEKLGARHANWNDAEWMLDRRRLS
jgi:hypothetical protein